MGTDLVTDKQYKDWFIELKHKVQTAQIKAIVKVNVELLTLYWELGADIVAKQATMRWGDKFILQLSKDLTAEFPDMKGFSRRNIELIRQWHLFYNQSNPLGQNPAEAIAKQAVSQITQIPWGHNVVIIAKCKDINEALYYVQNTLIYNWSRSVLVHQIESRLYQREGKALNNFTLTLPKPQSDLAVQTLKDPYIFDFLSLTKEYTECDLEQALVSHITQFLLEMGAGFAYIGRQVRLQVRVGNDG